MCSVFCTSIFILKTLFMFDIRLHLPTGVPVWTLRALTPTGRVYSARVRTETVEELLLILCNLMFLHRPTYINRINGFIIK